MKPHTQRKLALLTFDCVDEWLDGVQIDLSGFAQEMGSGWFNCLQSLAAVGVKTVLYGTSNRVTRTTRFTHEPTGSTICLLRSSGLYNWLKAQGSESHSLSAWEHKVPRIGRLSQKMADHARGYLSIPAVRFAEEMAADGCECLLVEQYATPRFDLSVLIGRLIGIPVFGHFASNCTGIERWTTRLVHPLRRRAFKNCAGLFAATSAEVARIRHSYGVPADRLGCIPFPVDTTFWIAQDKGLCRESLGIGLTERLAVWHGGIDIKVKGLDILISAWERIHSGTHERPWRLFIIGGASPRESQELNALIANSRTATITFVDRWIRDRKLLRSYLSAADVYVFPSRSDAFPIAALEAMSCSCPLVISSGAGVAELLASSQERGGIVVPVEDPDSLAEALEHFLSNAEIAAAVGRQARLTVEATASMETVGRRMADFLFPKDRPPAP